MFRGVGELFAGGAVLLEAAESLAELESVAEGLALAASVLLGSEAEDPLGSGTAADVTERASLM